MVEPLRMSPTTRRVLQVVGLVVLVAGLGVIGYAMLHFGDGSGLEMGDEGWFEAEERQGRRNFLTFAIGAVLTFAGGTIASLAFRKPMAELASTDTELAVEHSAAALGRGLSRGGLGRSAPQAHIRVKCRSCGHLETEDATFCSKCGKKV